MDVRIAIAGVGGKMGRTLIEQIAVSEGTGPGWRP